MKQPQSDFQVAHARAIGSHLLKEDCSSRESCVQILRLTATSLETWRLSCHVFTLYRVSYESPSSHFHPGARFGSIPSPWALPRHAVAQDAHPLQPALGDVCASLAAAHRLLKAEEGRRLQLSRLSQVAWPKKCRLLKLILRKRADRRVRLADSAVPFASAHAASRHSCWYLLARTSLWCGQPLRTERVHGSCEHVHFTCAQCSASKPAAVFAARQLRCAISCPLATPGEESPESCSSVALADTSRWHRALLST